MSKLPENFNPVLAVLETGGLEYAERHTLCVALNAIMDEKIQTLREEFEQKMLELQNETQPKKSVDNILMVDYDLDHLDKDFKVNFGPNVVHRNGR